eukprot:6492508-Amphidinium_carterae.1
MKRLVGIGIGVFEVCSWVGAVQDWYMMRHGTIQNRHDRSLCLTFDAFIALVGSDINVEKCKKGNDKQQWDYYDGKLHSRAGKCMDFSNTPRYLAAKFQCIHHSSYSKLPFHVHNTIIPQRFIQTRSGSLALGRAGSLLRVVAQDYDVKSHKVSMSFCDSVFTDDPRMLKFRLRMIL